MAFIGVDVGLDDAKVLDDSYEPFETSVGDGTDAKTGVTITNDDTATSAYGLFDSHIFVPSAMFIKMTTASHFIWTASEEGNFREGNDVTIDKVDNAAAGRSAY